MKAKRFFCLLLSVLMLLSVAQVSVLADTEINLTQAESLEEISKSVDEIISASPIEIKVNSEGQINSDVYEIISEGIASSEKYLQEQITQLNENDGVKYGFEWYITTLLRGGKKLDQAILDKYYNSVAQEIKGWNADIKPTDVERTALAMAVMDKAITNIDGINLAELIYNSPKLSNGANELAYALLALDATKTEIPSNAVWNRDKIVKELLKFQNSNGGFGLYDNQSSDVDMTAICLQALAPYKNDNEINISINKAVEYLKANISSDFDYSDNSISTAQALLALSALKIDVTASENGFGNENKNIITALEKYKNQNGYGYLYENKANSMATVQIMQAYDAYRKAHKENILYWDFSSKGNTYDDVSDSENSGNENNEAKPATVYVTISSKGEIARDKNGGYVAQAPVTVKDKNNDGKLTVDEALFATHEEYYNGGATAGYSTFEGAYGVSLAILWGEGSENVTASAGYWLNNESCMSLNDEIKSGDYLTAFNYYDTVYFSDSYSYFTESTKTTDNNSEVTLTLNYISGYDENWLPVSSPCPNARVKLLNGENSLLENLTTDENGQLKIENKLNAGAYYLVAYKEDSSIVPAVCKLVVTKKNEGSSGGSGSGGSGSSSQITVYIKVADPKGKTYLSKAPYLVKRDITVYELLEKTGLKISTSENAYGVYVKSIEDLAEFDEGAESGWMFRVNGDFSSTSASLYSLSQGDYVEWLYTRNLGKDLGDNSYISSSDNSTTYMVKFETNGGNTIDSQSVAINEIATEPNAPKKDGFIFEGWYTDKELTEKYDFSTMVTGEITLYAKWLEGEVVAVDEEVAISFDDVDVKAWYAEAVSYVTSNSLFNGVSKTEFAPNSNMTRAMLVTVLYRLEKPAKSEYKHSFADVEDNAWYAEAVKWAVENGIVKGINEKEFAPMENVTREQMAAIIYRYAKMKEYNTENLADLSEFEDFEKINEYAVEAIKWANANKIINGTNENRIEPQAFATRAEVAVILMRFCENVVK